MINKGISISYRPIQPSEIAAVRDLILRVFDEFVAPLYAREGVATFHDYVSADKIADRLGVDHEMFVAESGYKLIGIIETRNFRHISLLFVDKAFHGLGIGRSLISLAIAECRRENPDLRALTVNSSPNSVEVYARMGFNATGPEQTRDGIRFTPMALPVSAD